MTESSDAYWDELGVAWCAIDPDISVITLRLGARLRRQSRWITAGLVTGLTLGAVGAMLGAATIWSGWYSGAWNFVTRGVAIVVISAILTFTVLSLLSVRSWATTSALSEMIDFAISRAQRTLSLIRAGIYACVIAAVFGLVGTTIRTHLAAPPRMSPIVDLVVLALIALVLFLFGRQIQAELGKYRTLKHALAVDGEA
jgi:hypothetical protein